MTNKNSMQSWYDDYEDQNKRYVPVEQIKEKPSLVVEIKGFSLISKEDGFIIAKCHAADKNSIPESLPDQWKSKYNPLTIKIKGNSPTFADINSVGAVIECNGDWVLDPKHGLQFNFISAREAMPTSIEALEKYLSAGRIKGIGPATAKLIVKKWGLQTFDVLNNTPDLLIEIPGLTEKKVKEIKQVWEMKKNLYNLTSFFGMYSIGEVWIPKIVEKFGADGLEAKIRSNPYLLTDVDGIGFLKADKMALALGFNQNDPLRIRSMLIHSLEEYSDKNGHTARPASDWLNNVSSTLGTNINNINPIAQQLLNESVVIMRPLYVDTISLTGDEDAEYGQMEQNKIQCVSLKKHYLHERAISGDLRRIKESIKPLSDLELMELNKSIIELNDKLDPSQLEAVSGVLSSGLSILTGGPGTGKTTTLKSILDVAERCGWNVVLAAPTGRAAKRMTEAVGRPASTIHRSLKFNPKEGFSHHRANPLLGDFFVVDEASMLENGLGSSWLKAIPNGAKVLFLGDVDQLPSVGAGRFLKDLIDCGKLNVCRLNTVHRQAKGSAIGQAAQDILSGRMPEIGQDPWLSDFAFIDTPSKASTEDVNQFILTTIESLVDGLLKKGYHKDDIQVLTPQRNDLVGVTNLNQELRWKFNHHGVPKTNEEMEREFTTGDRVLVNKNQNEKEVFNGDMGIIQTIDDDGSMTLKMEDGRVVGLDPIDRKILTLGGAITVHKSQGGERPVIIMACSPSHTFTMNRNLIYTGITRGKSKVLMVGSTKTLMNVLRKKGKMYRLTGLLNEIENVFNMDLTNRNKIKR